MASKLGTEWIQVLGESVEVQQVGREIVELGVQDDAFFLLDLGDVVRKHEEWRRQMPRVRPHYAVKCNNNESVLRTLAALGAGFDCASLGEIEQIIGLGVEPERIIFANPAKTVSYLRRTATLGVDRMTFDNDIELRKIIALQPEATLVLRIRCDTKDAKIDFNKKYGCEPLLEAPELLRQARDLGGNVVGVSFHCGLYFSDLDVYRRALVFARSIFDVAETLGFHMTLVDIGGGFPGHTGSSLMEIASIVNKALINLFPSTDIEIIAEPGTFYVESAFTLYTQIIAKREVIKETEKHNMYFVNDGAFGSFVDLHYKIFPDPKPLLMKEGGLISSSVWGPTCASVDVINENVILPDLVTGDWLVFIDTGAYTTVLASTFNGYPVSRVHIVIDNRSWLLLKDKYPMKPESFVFDYNSTTLRLGLVEDAPMTR